MLSRLRERFRGPAAPGATPAARPETRMRLADSVVAGADGFLFHRDGHAFEQISGRQPLTPEIAHLWVTSIETRAAWCAVRDIPFRFLVVPEKHVVYADKLPDKFRPSAERPLCRIRSGLDGAARDALVYPDAELIAARSVRNTYQRTDTHWTSYGALLGCRALAASLAGECPLAIATDDEIAWTSRPHTGDLGVRLEPEPSETAETGIPTYLHPARGVRQNKIFARGALVVFESDATDRPRGILFRDSFAVFMLPFLAAAFSRLVVVGSQSMHHDLIKAERPDVVIVETCERFLGMPDPSQAIELPQDIGGPDIERFTDMSLAEITAPGPRPAGAAV